MVTVALTTQQNDFELYSQLFVCFFIRLSFHHRLRSCVSFTFEHSLEPAVFAPNGRSGSKRSTSPTTCQFRQQHHGTQQQQSKYHCGPGKSRATVRHGFYSRSSLGSAACVQQWREQSMQPLVGDVERAWSTFMFYVLLRVGRTCRSRSSM